MNEVKWNETVIKPRQNKKENSFFEERKSNDKNVQFLPWTGVRLSIVNGPSGQQQKIPIG